MTQAWRGPARTFRIGRGSDAILMECGAIEAAVLRVSLYWLAMEARSRRVDAVIVVPSINDAEHLACALPARLLNNLIAGNIVSMNAESLQLLTSEEVMPQTRRHQVVLTIGLPERDLERVGRRKPGSP